MDAGVEMTEVGTEIGSEAAESTTEASTEASTESSAESSAESSTESTDEIGADEASSGEDTGDAANESTELKRTQSSVWQTIRTMTTRINMVSQAVLGADDVGEGVMSIEDGKDDKDADDAAADATQDASDVKQQQALVAAQYSSLQKTMKEFEAGAQALTSALKDWESNSTRWSQTV